MMEPEEDDDRPPTDQTNLPSSDDSSEQASPRGGSGDDNENNDLAKTKEGTTRSGVESSTLSRVGEDEEDKVQRDASHSSNSDRPKNVWEWMVYWCTELMEKFHTARHLAGRFVNNKDVQLFIVILIGINGIMMGIGTFDFVRDNDTASKAFDIVDQIFLITFTIELGLQFLYHGWRLFMDGWLVFDFTIIVISWSFSSVAIVRAFRIFRALRLITRIKVMKNLILALFSVIPRMFAIGLLLFLVSYIFAVMFTQMFKDLFEDGHTDYDYFGRLDDTFLTLFQIMTLDNWADVARQVMAVYAWAWLPFITFVVITGFVVVNLIIAVICDAVSALEDEERAKLHGSYEDESTNEESQHPALQEDVREQLDVLETYVDELANMQEQTLRTLQILTKQLEEHKRMKEEEEEEEAGGKAAKASRK